MSAEIIQFRPRSTAKADRAFWIGPDPLEQMAIEIMNVALAGDDTAPCEYVAPQKDPA